MANKCCRILWSLYSLGHMQMELSSSQDRAAASFHSLVFNLTVVSPKFRKILFLEKKSENVYSPAVTTFCML